METLKCSPVSTEEEKIKFSLALALYASTNANNSVHERKDSEAVRSAVMQACSEILHKVQSFPRQYLIGGATNTTIAGFNQFAFTHVTSGAIEKLISLEELDSFSLRNSRSNIQTAGAQDEMYLKRKNLLNSDIMYDIVESLRNS